MFVNRGEDMLDVHGTAVALSGRGVLITGPSGSGKSGLALRLIAQGAHLVADDRVRLVRAGDGIVMRSPDTIRGKIEARGVGILELPPVADMPLVMVVDLGRASEARMPQVHTISYLDVAVRLIFGLDVPNIDAVLTIMLQNGCTVSP